MNCLKCGNAILPNGYCSVCGLKYTFVKKAFNSSEYYYNLGLDRAKVRDLTGAIDALKTSLKYNKKNTNARNLLGLIYYETSEVVLALSHWVVSANYDDSKMNRATYYIREIQSSPARLEAVSQLAKKYNLTLQYASQGNKDLALIQLKKILASHTHFVNGYLLLALLYMEDENYDKARKALKRVLRVDKTNTMAIRYMKEIGISEREIVGIRDDEDIFDDPEDFDGEEDFVRHNNASVTNLGDMLEGAEDGEASFKVGNYKEVNNSKYSLVYVGFGLLLGIIAVVFLIMPNKVNAVRNEYKDIKVSYSDEISKKNVTIEDLQSQVADLTEENKTLQGQIAGVSGENSASVVYDKLIVAYNLYENGSYLDAVKNIYAISRDSYSSEAAQSMYDNIMSKGKDREYSSLLSDGKNAYDANDYDKAIENLEIAVALDASADEPLYYLYMSYAGKGDSEKADALKKQLETNFPNSDFIGNHDTGIAQ